MKNNKRSLIWMITADFYPGIGGGERQAQRLAKSLIENGLDVRVVTRRHGFDHLIGIAAEEEIDGIPVKRIFSRGPRKIGSALFLLFGIVYLLFHKSSDIYHAHDVGTPAWIALIASRLCGGKALVKMRSGVATYQQTYSKGFAVWQFSTLLQWMDHIVVVNREVEIWLHEEFNIPRRKITFLPNGIDTTEFFPISAADKKDLRVQLCLPADMLIYLYIGRLSHVKGVDILLQAWSTLPRTIQEKSFLVIIGDGSEKKMLHQMCRNYNIAETVSILGSKQEVRDFYQAADVFILPSRTEGLSNALLEAMSSSLPVIASRVGGTPDIVTEGDEGFLFTAGNYLECATRIETLYSASELRNKMGRKARQKVIVCSDMTDLALRFKEIYITL